jgi:hypothetical protein
MDRRIKAAVTALVNDIDGWEHIVLDNDDELSGKEKVDYLVSMMAGALGKFAWFIREVAEGSGMPVEELLRHICLEPSDDS